LPPIDTAVIGWRHSVRLPRDHYVRLDSCDYSVHPAAVGHRVEVTADLDTVSITRAGGPVGTHARCWARQQTITDPNHVRAAQALRQAVADRPRSGVDAEVACRDLADYDRLFGLTGDEPMRQVA
ncbi:IS21 family transposase, partial [Dactylosporangium sp. NPDC000555]